MNISQSLKAITLYPIPTMVIENILDEVGLTASETISASIRKGAEYKRAVAQLYNWLALAPDVTEGDVHYTLTNAQRNDLKSKADAILAELDEDSCSVDGRGYMGEDL